LQKDDFDNNELIINAEEEEKDWEDVPP